MKLLVLVNCREGREGKGKRGKGRAQEGGREKWRWGRKGKAGRGKRKRKGGPGKGTMKRRGEWYEFMTVYMTDVSNPNTRHSTLV